MYGSTCLLVQLLACTSVEPLAKIWCTLYYHTSDFCTTDRKRNIVHHRIKEYYTSQEIGILYNTEKKEFCTTKKTEILCIGHKIRSFPSIQFTTGIIYIYSLCSHGLEMHAGLSNKYRCSFP